MTTIIHGDQTFSTPGTSSEGQLWLSLPELERIAGWELKEEGICRDELCIQMPSDPTSLLRTSPSPSMGASPAQSAREGRDEGEQFNLAAFAQHIEQPAAYDATTDTWYFGPPGWEWQSRLTSAVAPDFQLPDWNGQLHHLSDYKGRKIFLLAWASW